jgi:hypothetical protein
MEVFDAEKGVLAKYLLIRQAADRYRSFSGSGEPFSGPS